MRKLNDLKKMHDMLTKIFTTEAKRMLKTNSKVKNVLFDINTHFKKDGWPLDYEYYKYASEIEMPQVFNIILELKGYKMFYSRSRHKFCIKK